MSKLWMLALTLGDAKLEIAELRRLSLEQHVAFGARLFLISLGLEIAQTFQGVVPNDGRLQVGRCVFSWGTLDPRTPVTTMLPTRELDELGGDVDAVRRIVDGLPAAGAHIVLIPPVAVELVLFTRVSES